MKRFWATLLSSEDADCQSIMPRARQADATIAQSMRRHATWPANKFRDLANIAENPCFDRSRAPNMRQIHAGQIQNEAP